MITHTIKEKESVLKLFNDIQPGEAFQSGKVLYTKILPVLDKVNTTLEYNVWNHNLSDHSFFGMTDTTVEMVKIVNIDYVKA